MIILSKFGLVLNFVGTVMVCLSFGRNLGDAYQKDHKERIVYLASFLHPTLFRWGLFIIAFGFFLQLMG